MTQPPANEQQQDSPPRPLTQTEIDELREMLEAERRAKWLWASLRTWSVWVAAVVGGATIFWESAGRLLKAMVGK